MSPLAHLKIDGKPVPGLIIATRHVSGLLALLSAPKGEGLREGH